MMDDKELYELMIKNEKLQRINDIWMNILLTTASGVLFLCCIILLLFILKGVM